MEGDRNVCLIPRIPLKVGITINTSLRHVAKFQMIAYPLTFLQEGYHSNKQKRGNYRQFTQLLYRSDLVSFTATYDMHLVAHMN